MDYRIDIGEFSFVWDENKNQLNITNHKISFLQAATVFNDPHGRVDYDEGHSDYEERFSIIGYNIEGKLLVVCHCIREGGVIRIISARKAEKVEIRKYHNRRFE